METLITIVLCIVFAVFGFFVGAFLNRLESMREARSGRITLGGTTYHVTEVEVSKSKANVDIESIRTAMASGEFDAEIERVNRRNQERRGRVS